MFYPDNDSVRHALIRGVGLRVVVGTILQVYLRLEMVSNTCTWFARVPTEANVADFPSRLQKHPLFANGHDDSELASISLKGFLQEVEVARQLKTTKGEVVQSSTSHLTKRRSK